MTPALERLLSLAEIARLRIKELSPTADALVFELGEAIDEVHGELDRPPQQMHEEHLQEVLKWNR